LHRTLAPFRLARAARVTGRALRPEITRRERECLQAVSEGLDAEEIARALGIAARTVEAHVVSARLKLGCVNRAHLVAVAIKLGLVVGPDVTAIDVRREP
jgi:DNA-binding CsgD family transcriptional regulator